MPSARVVGRPVDPRRTARWAKLRKARLQIGRANQEPCCRCGREVDYSLHGNAKWGATVDHLRPIGAGGQDFPPLEDLGIAHGLCNSTHGAKFGNAKRRAVASLRVVGPGERPPASVRVPVDWSRLQGTVDVDGMPSDAAPPRLFSPRHPDATGTFATELLPWIRYRMAVGGQRLRWWQSLVLERLWEHDREGRLVWRTLVLSTPRQVGKSLLTREMALARAANPSLFGEPQVCMHTSRTLTNSTLLHSTAWQWAKEEGLDLLRRFGSERIGWPDGSRWAISSLEAIYGYAASVVTIDEAWDVQPKTVSAGALPVLASKASAQLHLLSTANRDTTDLMPSYRIRAARPGSNVMLAEWSAAPDADPMDIASFKAASPHWDRNREELIVSLIGSEDAPSQFLNQWPGGDGVQAQTGFPPGWIACPKVGGSPPEGGIAAVEVDLERSSCGVAVAVMDGPVVKVWTAVVPDIDHALAVLRQASPRILLAGLSLYDRLVREPGGWELRKAGTTESRLATPALLAAVRDGRLAHNHDRATDAQVLAAVAVPSESGPLLSARRSAGPISAVKAAAWAVQQAVEGPPGETWFVL